MSGYDAEEFERRALAGDSRAAVTVLSRSSVKSGVLEALMSPEADREIRITLAARQDVTPDQLAWIADCDDAYILNRAVSHPRTHKATIKSIRERAAGREGETWMHLRAFIDRVYGAEGITLIP